MTRRTRTTRRTAAATPAPATRTNRRTTRTPAAAPTTAPAATPARSYRYAHRDAVAFARHTCHARNAVYTNADGTRRRAAAASDGDHAAVRAWIADTAGVAVDAITVDAIMAAATVDGTRVSDVFRVASFDTSDGAPAPAIMRPVSDAHRGNAWRMGRYAAGIVAAWIVAVIDPAPRVADPAPADTPADTSTPAAS